MPGLPMITAGCDSPSAMLHQSGLSGSPEKTWDPATEEVTPVSESGQLSPGSAPGIRKGKAWAIKYLAG